MTVYLCEEHELAFEDRQQIQGHWNFQHGGKDRPDWEELTSDVVPEGYTMRNRPHKDYKKNPDAIPAAPVTPAPPDTRDTTVHPIPQGRVPEDHRAYDDEDANRLVRVLKGLSINDAVVAVIVNGFMSFDQVRSDPNYLASWIDVQFDRGAKWAKPYISMIIQEMFPSGGSTRFPIFTGQGGAPGGMPFPVFPQRGAHTPFNPYNAPYGTQWDGQQATAPPFESESSKQIKGLETQVRELVDLVGKERAERERTDREREINSRFDKMQDMILDLIKAKGGDEQHSTTEAIIARFSGEMKDMRDAMTQERFVAIDKKMDSLRGLIVQTRPDSTGRSTEDLAHEVAPIALDRLDNAGKDIISELKGLREQIGPSVRSSLERAGGARSIEDIEEIAGSENRLTSLYGQPEAEVEFEQQEGSIDYAQDGYTPDDNIPSSIEALEIADTIDAKNSIKEIGKQEEQIQDPALARMPTRTARGRRNLRSSAQ